MQLLPDSTPYKISGLLVHQRDAEPVAEKARGIIWGSNVKDRGIQAS